MLETVLSPWVPVIIVIIGIFFTITAFAFIPEHVYSKRDLNRFRLTYITGIILIVISILIAAIGFNTFPEKYITKHGVERIKRL